MESFFDSVLANLVTEFLVVVFGVLFANFVQRSIKQRRYGGWKLLLYQGKPIGESEDAEPSETPLLERALSADTAQRILYDDNELDIFLKGRISPFADVNCDLVTELKSGKSPVIALNRNTRRITVIIRSPKITLKSKPGGGPTR